MRKYLKISDACRNCANETIQYNIQTHCCCDSTIAAKFGKVNQFENVTHSLKPVNLLLDTSSFHYSIASVQNSNSLVQNKP